MEFHQNSESKWQHKQTVEPGQDGDFSQQALIDRNNNELANKLGNLVSRVAALAEKYGIEKCENKLIGKLKLKEIEKYSNFLKWGREKGAYLDKIEYPAAFGPKGELLGIAVACDIAAGETIMSVPCSMRIDFKTIMSSELGPFIKALGVDHDEEVVMALFFMH